MQPYQMRMRKMSIVLVATLFFGCKDILGVSGSPTGAIEISALVAGASIDRDPDGFTVNIDDGNPIRLGVTSLTLKDITAGSHSVKIGGVAPNCSVTGANPRTVEVAGGAEATAVRFDITCQPNVGTLKISAVTTGEEIS